MERSVSVASAVKQRKKLASLEAKLLLDSPNLPMRFVHRPKGTASTKTGQHYTFLLSSEYERTLWLDAVETLKGQLQVLKPFLTLILLQFRRKKRKFCEVLKSSVRFDSQNTMPHSL